MCVCTGGGCDISFIYLSSKALLPKTVQFLHLLDVQQLCFSGLHSAGKYKTDTGTGNVIVCFTRTLMYKQDKKSHQLYQ